MNPEVSSGFFAMAREVLFSDDGRMSIMQLLDAVFVPQIPASLGQCVFACHLTLTGAQGTVELPFRIVANRPAGLPPVTVAVDMLRVPHPEIPTQFRYVFDDLTLDHEGRYWFCVEVKVGDEWVVVTRWPIDVVVEDASDDGEE